jgi:serine/threonine-protein kinase RsbW
MALTSRKDPPGTTLGGIIPLLEFEFDQTSLAMLRREISLCSAACGLADLQLANFVLAVNEITTNAVRHAGGHGRLMLWRDDADVWCRITDEGPGIPRHALDDTLRPKPGLVRSCGLWLVRHICSAMEIQTDRQSGTSVLLRYPLPGVGP